MIDLRNYKELVKAAIKENAEKDKNWKWKMKLCKKNEITIWWSYLNEYLESKNMFKIDLEEVKDADSKEVTGYWLWARKPEGNFIEFWELELDGKAMDGRFGSLSIEDAMRQAVSRIINHALNVY